MSQYPTVYNQNAGDDEKDGVMGMDLGLDDENDHESLHSEYADGEEESKGQREVEVAAK